MVKYKHFTSFVLKIDLLLIYLLSVCLYCIYCREKRYSEQTMNIHLYKHILYLATNNALLRLCIMIQKIVRKLLKISAYIHKHIDMIVAIP